VYTVKEKRGEKSVFLPTPKQKGRRTYEPSQEKGSHTSDLTEVSNSVAFGPTGQIVKSPGD